jgi:hypothetical protein
VQHFLVDVLGGALFGLFVAAIVWEINTLWLQQWTGLDKGLLPQKGRVADLKTPPSP